MSARPENPLAFPGTRYGQHKSISVPGMTLRDWFAGQAIPKVAVMVFTPENRAENSDARLNAAAAQLAYDLADAMLAERERRK